MTISTDFTDARAELMKAQQKLAADRAAKADAKTLAEDEKAVVERTSPPDRYPC